MISGCQEGVEECVQGKYCSQDITSVYKIHCNPNKEFEIGKCTFENCLKEARKSGHFAFAFRGQDNRDGKIDVGWCHTCNGTTFRDRRATSKNWGVYVMNSFQDSIYYEVLKGTYYLKA